MIVALDLDISTLTTGSTTSYNTASLLLGNLIRRKETGDGAFVRPMDVKINRPFDYYGIDFRYIDVIPYSGDIDYVISGYNSVATQTTFTFKLASFNKVTETWTNYGRIFTTPVTGAAAVRQVTAIKGKLYRYHDGTVTVANNTVSGSGTAWADNRMFQGSRIGFGTTSSAEVTQWYEIQNVPTNHSLTINSLDPINYTSSVSYVIEELKLAVTHVNSTNTVHGGTMVIHGIHENTFSFGGTTIPSYGGIAGSGSFVDRTRGFINLKEQKDTIYRSPGPALFDQSVNTNSAVNDYLYVFNQTGSNGMQILRYNLGTAITAVDTGSSYSQFNFAVSSGSSTFVTAPSRLAFFAKPSHGPGSGSNDIYFVSVGRLTRIKLSDIYSGSNSIGTDNYFEVPPMSVNNFLSFGSSVNYAYLRTIDRFITAGGQAIPFNTAQLFEYNTVGKESERRILMHSNMANTATTRPYPNFIYTTHGSAPTYGSHEDLLYVTIGGSNTNNIWYTIPAGADYKYAPQTKQWAVFPKLNTPSNKKFKEIFIKSQNQMAPENLGFPPERVFAYYRTSGIDDDSGDWTLLAKPYDMSDITVSDEIQFAIAWDVFGSFALYPEVYGITLVYENDSQISQYIPSLTLTDVANRRFAWRQAQLFSTTNIPTLQIRLYNSETGNLILEDTTAIQTQGTFQYSLNSGSSWNAWDNTKNNVNNYIRYTATALPANTLVNAVITEA